VKFDVSSSKVSSPIVPFTMDALRAVPFLSLTLVNSLSVPFSEYGPARNLAVPRLPFPRTPFVGLTIGL
jgi:hypothetical protein